MTPLIGSASRLCPRHADRLAEACARTLDTTNPARTPVVAWSQLAAELEELRAMCTAMCQRADQDPCDAYDAGPLSHLGVSA